MNKIKFDKFETEIDEISFFDNRKSNKYKQQIIIWLHLTNCEKLQKEIDNTLSDLFEKEKRFMSHLTIARIKNFEDKKKFLEKIFNIKIKKEKFEIDRFYLMKSKLTRKGAIYSVLEEFLSR